MSRHPGPVERTVAAALRRPRAVSIWVAALFAAGAVLASQIPVEWVPSLALPELSITSVWPGASPEAVERSVTAPIERALAGMPGIRELSSLSRPGASEVSLEIAPELDPRLVSAQVADRLAWLEGSLPPEVVPHVRPSLPTALRDERGFMTVELFGDTSSLSLRSLADQEIAPRLNSLPGVGRVLVDGGEQRELLVRLADDRLAASGVTPFQVVEEIRNAVRPQHYGLLRQEGRTFPAFRPGVGQPQEISLLPLAAPSSDAGLRIGDVATVTLGPGPRRSISRIDGKPAVTLTLDRAPESHLLSVSRRVRDEVHALGAELPPGVHLEIAADLSEKFEAELRDLLVRGAAGLLLIALVLRAIFGSFHFVAVSLGIATLALGVALALFQPLGLTLNVLTLAGLALLAGLVIDAAVVVAARVDHRARRARRLGQDRSAAKARAAGEVWLPLLGGLVTTVAACAALSYASGELRGLFGPFTLLVSLTLGIALVAAVVLVPVFSRPRSETAARPEHRLRRTLLWPSRLAARYPKTTLLTLALLIGLPTPLLPERLEEPARGWESEAEARRAELYNRLLGSDPVRRARLRLDPLLGGVTRPFLEEVPLGQRWDFAERPEVLVLLRLPSGSGLQATAAQASDFEAIAIGEEGVDKVLSRTRGETARVRILFNERAIEGGRAFEIRERLIAHAVGLAGLDVTITGLIPFAYHSGIGSAAGFKLEAYGPEYHRLDQLLETLADRLRQEPRVAAVDTHAAELGSVPTRETLRLAWSADARRRSGLTAAEVGYAVEPRLARHSPYFRARIAGQPDVGVRFVAADAEGLTVQELMATPLPTGVGPRTLDHFARLTPRAEPPGIERRGQTYRRLARVHFRGPRDLGEERIRQALSSLPIPPGYRIELQSFTFLSEDNRGQVLSTLGLAVLLVFLVLAAVVESWRGAFIALAGVPLAWIGVSLAFVWSGKGFAEGAFIGVLLVIGIAVNDGVLLVDRIQRLQSHRGGRDATDPALLLAGVRQRLTPMWATSLTTVCGLLPLCIHPPEGTFWVGLAITVIGGLASSTLLVPPATVAAYRLMPPSRNGRTAVS